MAAPSTATNEAVLMTEPLPWRCMYGITCLQHRYTEVRLTSCTRRQASSPVLRIESSSGGEMPALLNAMSIRAVLPRAASYSCRTSSSLVTSAGRTMPPTSSATSLPAALVDVGHDDLGALRGEAGARWPARCRSRHR